MGHDPTSPSTCPFRLVQKGKQTLRRRDRGRVYVKILSLRNILFSKKPEVRNSYKPDTLLILKTGEGISDLGSLIICELFDSITKVVSPST